MCHYLRSFIPTSFGNTMAQTEIKRIFGDNTQIFVSNWKIANKVQ